MASGSRDVNDLKVAMVRPYGYHFLDVYINEMYSPLSKIKYITADFNMEEWNWLKLTKIEPVKLSVRPTFLFDPFFLRRGAYGIFSIARLIGMEKAMEGTDVVDTSEITTSFSYQTAKLSTKLNVPLITSVIETIPHHISTLIPPYSHYAKFVLKKTDAFIALTKRSEIFLKRAGANNEAINLLHPGIDTSLFHPGITDDGEKIKVLFVGSLSKNKGIDDLLKVCRTLSEDYSNLELWVCGQGPMVPLVKDYSKHFRIKYLGSVPWRKMPEVYRSCDIFSLPSKDLYKGGIKIWEEQFGIALVEAMASGLPIVATDSGSIPDVIGDSNHIVLQSDLIGLKDALRIFIEDEKQRRAVGMINRERATRLFDGEKNAKSYADLIARTVSS